MGHYYSEMMCDTCGKVRCECMPNVNKPNLKWVVDEYDNMTI
jgi:hypothetical protein